MIKNGAYPGDEFGATKVQKYFQGIDNQNAVFAKMKEKMQKTYREGERKHMEAVAKEKAQKRAKSKY